MLTISPCGSLLLVVVSDVCKTSPRMSVELQVLILVSGRIAVVDTVGLATVSLIVEYETH